MYVPEKDYVMTLSNKLKICFYLVYQEDRKRVSAIARGCEKVGWISCVRKFRSFVLKPEAGSKLAKDLLMSDTYVGRANCHPSDSFDFQVGAKLAIDRLKAKLEYAIAGREIVLRRVLQRYIWSLEMAHVDGSRIPQKPESPELKLGCKRKEKKNMFDETKFMIDSASIEDELDDAGEPVENICIDEETDNEEEEVAAVVDEEIVNADMDGFDVNKESFDNTDGTAEPVVTICEDEDDDAPQPLVDAEDVQIANAVADISPDALKELA